MNDIILKLQDMRYLKWTKSRNSSGTAGSFLKSYDDTGSVKLYYKLSDYDSLNGIVGHECINEIIAQRVLSILGIEHLEYRLIHALIRIDDKDIETYLCESYDFKMPGETKLPLEDFYQMQRKNGESPMDFCIRNNMHKFIYEMLIIDFLIINRDRHGANIEILFDRKNRTFRPAPLFDHGLSFVFRCRTTKEVTDFDAMGDVRVQSFVGGSSTFQNLNMVPKSYIKQLGKLQESDRDRIFEGIENIIGPVYCNKIWEILMRRWSYLEDIRNS